jgi:hypothetical protein
MKDKIIDQKTKKTPPFALSFEMINKTQTYEQRINRVKNIFKNKEFVTVPEFKRDLQKFDRFIADRVLNFFNFLNF